MNIFANIGSVFGLNLTADAVVGILLGVLIAVIAYYQRKIKVRTEKTRQYAFIASRDMKHIIAQLKTELDALLAIRNKNESAETAAAEYQYWVKKAQASIQKIERYPIKDIEKMT